MAEAPPATTDPITAIGNSVNDLRAALDSLGKKYDAALAELAKRIPEEPPKPPATHTTVAPCSCSTCKFWDAVLGL